jgi:hypothetical protein
MKVRTFRTKKTKVDGAKPKKSPVRNARTTPAQTHAQSPRPTKSSRTKTTRAVRDNKDTSLYRKAQADLRKKMNRPTRR